MAQSILTKADIQAFAPELDLSSYSDATISGMCSQATNRATQFCSVKGFDFATETNETDRAYISNEGELHISVRRRPIVSVTSINLVKGGFTTALTLTDTNGAALYQLEYPGNKIVLPNSYLYMSGTYLAGGSSQLFTLRGARVFYQMTYAGGFQTIPDDLKYAVMLYFRDVYQKQFNTQQMSSFSQGSYSENYAGVNNTKGRSNYIQEAESILMNGGYVRLEF
jgi:hypothetical protein